MSPPNTGDRPGGLPPGLDAADRLIKALNAVGSALAAIFLVLIVVVGVADVIGTNLLRAPVPSSLEITQFGMVFVTFGGLAYAFQRGSHVGVDLFVGKMPPSARRLALGVTLIIAFCLFAFIGWRAGIAAIESLAIDEHSSGLFRFPIYPAKAALSLGCALAALEAVRQFVRLCLGASEDTQPAKPEEQIL